MTLTRSDLRKKTLRCLLIEDNPGDVDLLKQLLSEAPGIEVTVDVCDRLRDAASLNKETLNFVLLDLNLPDSIGIETLRTAKLFFPDQPIILLTGVDEPEITSQAFQEGAQDYLVKGTFSPRELSRTILHAVERHALDHMPEALIESLVESPVEDNPTEASQPGNFPAVILVVEDEADLRSLNCEFLRVKGYRVLEAEDGDEALEIWDKEKDSISLLLTDYLLPGSLTGKQLAEVFAQEKSGLKILITSGTPSGMTRMKSQTRIEFEFLQKPYSMPDLVNTVEACLQKPA